ncbi:MAG TPA: hypothetical protein VFK47_11325 [Ktedonobacteraceae bacterium]|nr:hypothetical protein [Ktedonobacteraceae bacterium]
MKNSFYVYKARHQKYYTRLLEFFIGLERELSQMLILLAGRKGQVEREGGPDRWQLRYQPV